MENAKVISERGVYRLAAAVLLQAIQDAGSSSIGKRASALKWMNSSDQSCYSFLFICRVLNRNPDEVRRFCLNKASGRRKPEMPFPSHLHQRTFHPSALTS